MLAKNTTTKNNTLFKRLSGQGCTEEGTLKRRQISLEVATMYKEVGSKCEIVERFYQIKLNNYFGVQSAQQINNHPKSCMKRIVFSFKVPES